MYFQISENCRIGTLHKAKKEMMNFMPHGVRVIATHARERANAAPVIVD
jgi:hypothetical protein